MKNNKQGGFLNLIIIIVVALLVLNYYHISVSDAIEWVKSLSVSKIIDWLKMAFQNVLIFFSK